MKKTEQGAINAIVINAINSINTEEYESYIHIKRLRTCTAYVKETPKYYLLESYNTIVAAIDKQNDTLYDFLRLVYGYTSTSAQHIAKFDRDYSSSKRGCKTRYTYRDI